MSTFQTFKVPFYLCICLTILVFGIGIVLHIAYNEKSKEKIDLWVGKNGIWGLFYNVVFLVLFISILYFVQYYLSELSYKIENGIVDIKDFVRKSVHSAKNDLKAPATVLNAANFANKIFSSNK
jgi:hypothetical protein